MARRRKIKSLRSSITTNSIDLYLNNQKNTATKSNKFDILTNAADMNVDSHASTSFQAVTVVAKNTQKVPPIDSSTEFSKVLKQFGNDGYFFRRTSMGTKIFSDNMEKYLSLLQDLKSTDFRYHTHKIYDNSNYKMILKGLHNIPTNILRDELLNYHGVKCTEIKEIKVFT